MAENPVYTNEKTKPAFDADCPICLELSGEAHQHHDEDYRKLIADKTNIIWSGRGFSMLASLGPLNRSHLLVVPNRHVRALSALTPEELRALQEIKLEIRRLNARHGRHTEFFEHGCGAAHNGSACIEHAHLHAVATRQSVLPLLSGQLRLERIGFVDLSREHRNKKSGYVLIEDIAQNAYLLTDNIVPSQYLRMCYARLFRLKNWDWRKDAGIGLVKKIIRQYRAGMVGFAVE